MAFDSFNTRDTLTVDDTAYTIYRLNCIPGSSRLPYSLKVLLENLLRNEDDRQVAAEQIRPCRAGSRASNRHRKSSTRRHGC